MDNAADSVYAGIFETLQEKGVAVDAAAGNEFSAGYGNNSGKNLAYASDPDSSTLDEPASYAPVVAVASLDNVLQANGSRRLDETSPTSVRARRTVTDR